MSFSASGVVGVKESVRNGPNPMPKSPHEVVLSEDVERGIRGIVSVERQLCPCHCELITA